MLSMLWTSLSAVPVLVKVLVTLALILLANRLVKELLVSVLAGTLLLGLVVRARPARRGGDRLGALPRAGQPAADRGAPAGDLAEQPDGRRRGDARPGGGGALARAPAPGLRRAARGDRLPAHARRGAVFRPDGGQRRPAALPERPAEDADQPLVPAHLGVLVAAVPRRDPGPGADPPGDLAVHPGPAAGDPDRRRQRGAAPAAPHPQRASAGPNAGRPRRRPAPAAPS